MLLEAFHNSKGHNEKCIGNRTKGWDESGWDKAFKGGFGKVYMGIEEYSNDKRFDVSTMLRYNTEDRCCQEKEQNIKEIIE